MSPDQAGNPLFQLFPFIAIFLIFYFLVIKPERSKQNERKNQVESMKKNDRVVTSGGIHGTVVIVKEKTVVIRVDENVRLELDKDSIASVQQKSGSSKS